MKIAMPYQDGVLLEHFGRAKEFIIYNVSDLDPVTSEVIAPADLSHAAVARALKEHGVEVYFEEQNICTLDSKGELLLTIMSSLAQEESRSISENVTWGQRKRFAERRDLRESTAGTGTSKKAEPPAQQPALLLRENLLRLLWQRVRQQGLAFQRQIPTHRLAMQRPVRQRNWMPSAAPERTDD